MDLNGSDINKRKEEVMAAVQSIHGKRRIEGNE
jgi:hypothetical protein